MALYTPTTIITVCTIGSTIGLLLTSIRFYVRLRYAPTRLGPDDFFIVLATILMLLFYSLYMYDTVEGTAGNATTAADYAAVVEHMMDYAMITTEKFAYGAVKLSLLFFFRRIFGVWPTFRAINNAMIAVVALWSLGFFFAAAFICGAHPERYWAVDQRFPAETCGNGGAALVAYAATSVATDVMILSVPLIYVQRILMDSRSKKAVSFVFLLGFISTAAGILRLIMLSVAYPMGRLAWTASSLPSADTPYVLEVINPAFWGIIELELAIWAANLPPLSPLLKACWTVREAPVAKSACSRCDSPASVSTPGGVHPSELIHLPIPGGRL